MAEAIEDDLQRRERQDRLAMMKTLPKAIVALLDRRAGDGLGMIGDNS